MKMKLTESKLKQIVAESVKKVLNENDSTPTSHRYTPNWGDENRKKIQMQVSKDRQKARLKIVQLILFQTG